jgi:hypothetical protein
MINWLLTLSTGWLIVVVLAGTYLVAAIIYFTVMRLAAGERVRTFSGLSPGMLPPLGIVFGLIVAFLASGIWSNASAAQTAVNNEASSLRASVLLVHEFPGAPETEMRLLIARHIDQIITLDWPAMAKGTASISTVPQSLGTALQLALGLTPHSAGQTEAQRELVTNIETALDARRQRIIVSRSQVNWVKWTGVTLLGALLLVAIAFVHCERPATAAVAITIFATAIGVSLVLILSQDRAFGGPFAIKPTALVQVRPAVQ